MNSIKVESSILSGNVSLELADISTYVDKTASEVVEYLVGHDLKIAVAESCTGGLLAGAITSVSGASRIFECGAVTYSERIKSELLGIPMEVINTFGVVSDKVALAMAVGVKKLADSDIGVGITGIAGPGGGTESQPVGTIYVSVVYKNASTTENIMLHRLSTALSREENRLLAVGYALEAVLSAVKE